MEYNFNFIEEKWQRYWREHQTYKTDIDKTRPKYYVLDMFPYPSGAGLHVGHPLGYIASDIVSRYKRLKGFNVLHPMGYDAFGLPAEQYAIQTGQHPRITTEQNINRYRDQLDKIGFSFDWSREIRTCEPSYYKWTQWIFIKLFHSWYNSKIQRAESIDTLIGIFETEGFQGEDHLPLTGNIELELSPFTSKDWFEFNDQKKNEILLNFRLAYLSEAWVNWCAALGTVLANDEVKDGVSERGGYPVERKRMPQWSLRITAFADRLLNDLDTLDWTDSIKEAQRNWIGKSEGTSIRFKVMRRYGNGGSQIDKASPHPDSYRDSPLENLKKTIEDRGSQLDKASPQPSPSLSAKKTIGDGGSPVDSASPQPSPKERELDSNFESYLEKQLADPTIYNYLKEFARSNRKSQTKAEELLWNKVRNYGIGFKIRRQHPIGPYIADFICIPKKLIIEIDGEVHNSIDQKEIDENRTELLNELGFKVIRFTNTEIIKSTEEVLSKIKTTLENISPSLEERGPGGEAEFSQELRASQFDRKTTLDLDDLFIEVFTTRPDTIFGVSFVTLAPEIPLVDLITTQEYKTAVNDYVTISKNRTERERQAEVKRISGQFTGAYVIHPFTGKDIPVWIGDYVLAGYGTGAVMAVPGHDSRDHAFAKHFGLPIIKVVEPPSELNHPGIDIESYDDKSGKLVHSEFLNGLDVKLAIHQAIDEIEKHHLGKGRVNYRLRDAAFGRQRYWGEPIPVYYKDGVPQTLDESELPLILPEIDKFQPTEDGEPPLARAKDWKYKGKYDYEHTTMPGWAGSSWYFLRYMDANNDKVFASKDALDYWKNVDFYLGGAEHSTGHLLYVRFWTKFLFDRGYIPINEPAQKLINQGMIQGVSAFVYRINGENKFVSYGLKDQYQTNALHVDVNISPDHVLNISKFREWREEYKEAEFILEDGKYICGHEVEKMSKSKWNVVSPDDIIVQYGADTLRLYEMFLGPLEQSKPWSTQGISGVHNFLRRMWRLYHDSGNNFRVTDEPASPAELKTLHRTIKKVEEDVERFSFNTTISTFMICVNELTDLKCNKRTILESLVILISPYAPHFAEELWQNLGYKGSVTKSKFPTWKEEYLVEENFEYPVSVNGKVRFKINLSLTLSKEDIEQSVLSSDEIGKYIQTKPKKVIVVPGRIVNVVV